ncbi:MAG: hypothetical protein N2747_09775 [Chitinophagaceae bacterium]|nr:hypothetical protein [Chitinophagaceae bacterium]
MKTTSVFKCVGMIFLWSTLFYACTRETSQTGEIQEREIASVSGEADSEAETIFNECFDNALGVNNNVAVGGSGVFFGRTDSLTPVPRCFAVTLSNPNNTPFPVVVTIDFGTAGCIGPDGRVRRGKIIIEYTNRMTIPGAVATTTFQNYYVDDKKVEGKHKVTNISTPQSPPTVVSRDFKVEVIDGKITKPNGDYTEWNSMKTVKQIEGLGTPDLSLDDVFRIEGSAEGRVKRGNLLVRWESQVTEPLIRRFTCRWIVKGVIKARRVNLPANSVWVAVLDYGNGLCDNKAILTVNGITRQITLP